MAFDPTGAILVDEPIKMPFDPTGAVLVDEPRKTPFDPTGAVLVEEPSGIGGTIKAAISGAVGGAAGLGGGAALAELGTVSGFNPAVAAATGPFAPLTMGALIGGEWLIGGYLAGKAKEEIQKQVISPETQREIAAHPTAESIASMAVQLPLLAKSAAGLAKLSGGERLAKLAGGFGVGAALEPARYAVETGLSQTISAATGKPAEPVAPITFKSTLESAAFGAALSGLGERGLTETAKELQQGEINATQKRIIEQSRQSERKKTGERELPAEAGRSYRVEEGGEKPEITGRKIISTAVEHERGILALNDPSAPHAQIGEELGTGEPAEANRKFIVQEPDGTQHIIGREEALTVAREAGQLKEGPLKEEGKLHSEDLKLTPGPELRRPGAAHITDFPPQRKISVKNAWIDQDRARRGLPPLMSAAKVANETTWETAMDAVDKNPEIGSHTVDALLDGSKTTTSAHDHAILDYELARMHNERDMAQDRASDPNSTEAERRAARNDVARHEDRLNEIEKASRQAGSISGASLQFRKRLIADDYTLAAMERKTRASGDRGLTTKEKELQARITELEKQAAERESKVSKEREGSKDVETDKEIDKMKSRAKGKKPPGTPEQQQAKIISAIERKAKEGNDVGNLIQQLAEHFVGLNLNIDRDTLVKQVHDAVKQFLPDSTPRDIRDAISGYGKYKELSKEEVKVKLRDLKGQMQQSSKIDDMLNKGELPAKTGTERRIPTLDERSLMKEVNKIKKELGLESDDPNKLKSALATVKTRLTNRIEELKQAIAKGEAIPKSERVNIDDAEAKSLRSELASLEKQYKDVIGLETDAIESAKQRTLEKSISDLEEQIRTGAIEGKAGIVTVDTEAIAKLKAQKNDLLLRKKEIIKAKYPPKTPEEIQLMNLESHIADVRERIAQGDIRTKSGKPTVDTEAVAAAKEELRALNKRMDDLRRKAKPPKTPEEIREAELDQRIKELEAKIEAGDISAKQGKPTVDTLAIAEKKNRLESLNKQLAEMRKISKPSLTPEQIALKIYKTRTENRIKEFERRISEEDYSKAPKREPLTLDEPAQKLKVEAERLKQEFQQGLRKEQLAKRTPLEKAQDTFVKWRRAFVLSSPVTLAKLTSAAAERMLFTPIEELIGEGLLHVPGISEVAERAPREGGISARAEAKAITEGFTKGMKDAWDILKTGQSELDILYGKKNPLPREGVEFIGRIHGALKTVAKRNEFARSFEKRIADAIANSVDVSDPLVQTKIAADAYKDANKAIFMQDNRVVDAYKRALSALEQPDKITGKVPPGSKAIAVAMRTLLPIVKVPINVVAETMQYAFGSVTGSIRLANAMRAGVENIRPEQADLIMRELKKGSLGAAVMLLGFFNPQSVGGYYQPGEKRGKEEAKVASLKLFGVNVPSYLIHNPLLETLQIGSTIRRVSDSKLKKSDADTQGIAAGVWAGALGLTSEVPFILEMGDVTKAYNPKERGAFVGELTKSIIVPQGIQWLATQTDKDIEGETIKRAPETILQHVETGLPGLRKSVPEKKKKQSDWMKDL